MLGERQPESDEPQRDEDEPFTRDDFLRELDKVSRDRSDEELDELDAP